MTSQIKITVFGCEQDEATLFGEVAPRFGVEAALIEEPLSQSNAWMAMGNHCVSVGHKSQITESILLALKMVGVAYLSTRSIGLDHIDLKAAKRLGIAIGNVSYSSGSVADFTVMLMLMAVRNMKSIAQRSEQQDYRLEIIRAKELRDMTVGVVGTGHIGQAVIDRLHGFGCNILTYNHHSTSASLDVLIKESDIITLHLPLDASTYHFLDESRIKQMKNGALLINTGRGGLVDTESLVLALESKKLGGAALDVLEGEEGIFYTDCRNKTFKKQLLKLRLAPNVLITPHTAYYTDHSLRDTVEQTVNQCLEFERRTKNEQTENCYPVRRLLGRT